MFEADFKCTNCPINCARYYGLLRPEVGNTGALRKWGLLPGSDYCWLTSSVECWCPSLAWSTAICPVITEVAVRFKLKRPGLQRIQEKSLLPDNPRLSALQIREFIIKISNIRLHSLGISFLRENSWEVDKFTITLRRFTGQPTLHILWDKEVSFKEAN